MNRKGLSQVLALIVAASVLMMTALTVVFMVQGGLGGLDESTTQTSCTRTIQTICRGSGVSKPAPASCTERNAEGEQTRIPNAPTQVTCDGGSCTVDCTAFNNPSS